MNAIRTVRDMDFTGKRVFLRLDLNVPMKNGEVQDDYRIQKSMDTIRYLLSQCENLVITSHLGRPGGKKDPELSLRPVAQKIEEYLGERVAFVNSSLPESLPDENIIVLENMRFHPGEDRNDSELAEKLSSYADIYVNDAFGIAHRTLASTVGIADILPGCIGLQMEKELKYLNIEDAESPIVAILGGAKLKTKLPVIKHFLKKVDKILLGGAMIFTFYKFQGKEIGKSLLDQEYLERINGVLDSGRVILPEDVVVAESMESDAGTVVSADNIPPDMIGLDIGPETVNHYKELLKNARTIIWNGPLGYYESEGFAKSTNEIAKYLAELDGPKKIIGGGDTAAVVSKLGLVDKYTHVSTGGGASLELMSGKELPGLTALRKNGHLKAP